MFPFSGEGRGVRKFSLIPTPEKGATNSNLLKNYKKIIGKYLQKKLVKTLQEEETNT